MKRRRWRAITAFAVLGRHLEDREPLADLTALARDHRARATWTARLLVAGIVALLALACR